MSSTESVRDGEAQCSEAWLLVYMEGMRVYMAAKLFAGLLLEWKSYRLRSKLVN
jgi:hypothetical protein